MKKECTVRGAYEGFEWNAVNTWNLRTCRNENKRRRGRSLSGTEGGADEANLNRQKSTKKRPSIQSQQQTNHWKNGYNEDKSWREDECGAREEEEEEVKVWSSRFQRRFPSFQCVAVGLSWSGPGEAAAVLRSGAVAAGQHREGRRCESAPPRSALDHHYLRHCQEQKLEPVNAATFGKLVRLVFTGLRTRRLGTRGNSKWHYDDLRIKANSGPRRPRARPAEAN